MKFKLSWEHFTWRSYIRHLRRQNKHVQRVHAVLFAGIITALIAAFVLYTDYGFWHETYHADGTNASTTAEILSSPGESPVEALSRFWGEARMRLDGVGSSSAHLLEGKETYTR